MNVAVPNIRTLTLNHLSIPVLSITTFRSSRDPRKKETDLIVHGRWLRHFTLLTFYERLEWYQIWNTLLPNRGVAPSFLQMIQWFLN